MSVSVFLSHTEVDKDFVRKLTLLEAEGNFVSYVHVELKNTAPWYQNREFDSEPILGAFSIQQS